MIVVVGTPAWHPADPARPAGLACEVAMAVAAGGHPVELVGRTGDDPAGDELLLALSGAGVGHVALLRDAARPTRLDRGGGTGRTAIPGEGPVEAAPPELEPADVSLGLAYLTRFEVLVVADDVPVSVLPVCVDAASFAGARLVVVRHPRSAAPADLPDDATVLVAPAHDEPAFAQLVGRYAAGLADGSVADGAFEAATRATGWELRGGPS